MTGRPFETQADIDRALTTCRDQQKRALASGDTATAAEWRVRLDALLERRPKCPAA